MRNNWNLNTDRNMGPRGPRYSRTAQHRPADSGLISLLIGFCAAGPAIVIALRVISAVFRGMAFGLSGTMFTVWYVIARAFYHARVSGGLAAGIAIGLIAYRMIRAKKEENAAAEREADGNAAAAQESVYAETQHYRFHA